MQGQKNAWTKKCIGEKMHERKYVQTKNCETKNCETKNSQTENCPTKKCQTKNCSVTVLPISRVCALPSAPSLGIAPCPALPSGSVPCSVFRPFGLCPALPCPQTRYLPYILCHYILFCLQCALSDRSMCPMPPLGTVKKKLKICPDLR